MTVTLNEGALRALLDSQEGPVGQFVQRQAQKVVDAMKDDVKGYFVGADFGIENDVGLIMEGSTAVVGLRNDPEGKSRHTESKSARYARLGEWKKTHDLVGQ